MYLNVYLSTDSGMFAKRHRCHRMHTTHTHTHTNATQQAMAVTDSKEAVSLSSLQADNILHHSLRPKKRKCIHGEHEPHRSTDTQAVHPCHNASANSPDDLDRLQHIHPHERDQHITFDTYNHKYFWKGAPVRTSVTQVVSRFSENFDPQHTIETMRSGIRWPRADYIDLHALQTLKEKDLSFLPENTEQLRRLLKQPAAHLDQICLHLSRLRYEHPELEDFCQRLTFDDETIKFRWNTKAREASEAGTRMHAQFEKLLNGGTVAQLTPEIRLLVLFLDHIKDTKAYRTEWKIYSEKYALAGTIDFVAEHPNGDKLIIDWKRTSQLKQKHHNYGRQMLPPIQHMPDCPLSHYRLQLNIYRHILVTEYGQTVRDMYIVGTHPDNGEKPWIDVVPTLHDETTQVLEEDASAVPPQAHTTNAEPLHTPQQNPQQENNIPSPPPRS